MSSPHAHSKPVPRWPQNPKPTKSSTPTRPAQALAEGDGSGLVAAHSQLGGLQSFALPGNVCFNDLGQGAVIGRDVTVITPHQPHPPTHPSPILPTLPPPPALPIILDDSSTGGRPTHPPEHIILPLWVSKLPITPAPPPNAGEGYLDARACKREVADPEGGTEGNMFLEAREVGVKAVCWSPAGLTDVGGCLLAVLDTSLNLTVRTAEKDSITNEWVVRTDITRETFLRSAPSKQPGQAGLDNEGRKVKSELMREMELQTMAMAWSPAPCFDAPYAVRPWASILAVGNRTGEIALWTPDRFPGAHGGMTRQWNKRVSERWVSMLAWSQWEESGLNARTANLAFANPEGSIYTIEVTRILDPMRGTVEMEVGNVVDVWKRDNKILTGLKWIHGALVWGKFGSIYICNLKLRKIQKLDLSKIGSWANCSPYSQLSGLTALPNDSLLVSASSGEQHLIRAVSSATPTLDMDDSKTLTNRFRGVLEAAEPDNTGEKLSMRVQGFAGVPNQVVGGSLLFASVHEPLKLHDLSTPKEFTRSFTISMFDLPEALLRGSAVAPRDDMEVDEVVSPIINQSPACTLSSFLPLIYRPSPSPNPSPYKHHLSQVPSSRTDPFKALVTRQALVDRLAYELKYGAGVYSLSMQNTWLSWQQATQSSVSYPFGVNDEKAPAKQAELATASILLWLSQAISLPLADAMSNGTLLASIAKTAKGKSCTKKEPTRTAFLNVEAAALSVALMDVESICPICGDGLVDQVMGETTLAVCRYGHQWNRCSLTHELLQDTSIRTCCTCGRKALLGDAVENEDMTCVDGAWMKRDLLKACQSCPFCGGQWKRMV